MKILNLYSGIGGNRKLWGDEDDITAVELDPKIAAIYQDFFPKDKMIITDAHQYLLEHFKEYDFIWSSPPCQSHSRARFWGSFGEGLSIIYPDMKLYQEILLMANYCRKIRWAVENVKPYYSPLIKAIAVGRHLVWSNFHIPRREGKAFFFPKDSLPTLQKKYGVDLSGLDHTMNKRVILRNMVEPETGLYIFNQMKLSLKKVVLL